MTRFESAWNAVEDTLLSLLALLALAMICFEVLARYWIPAILPDWGAEVIMYLTVTAVLLAGNQLVLSDRHIRADLFVQRLPVRLKRMIDFGILILGFLYCTIISWFAVAVVRFAHMIDIRSDSSLQFKQWIFYLVLPVAFGLMAIRYLLQIVRFWRHGADQDGHGADQDGVAKTRAEPDPGIN